jgi:hypothetical protein
MSANERRARSLVVPPTRQWSRSSRFCSSPVRSRHRVACARACPPAVWAHGS